MATPKNPSAFFVGLHDTKDLKRALLESTRDTIMFMQKYENILKIRKEKNEAIDHLKKLVKEINKMVSSLKQKLPESEIHRKLGSEEIAIEKQILSDNIETKERIAKPKLKPSKANNEKKENSTTKGAQEDEPDEMEKLESQLKELENRLKGF